MLTLDHDHEDSEIEHAALRRTNGLANVTWAAVLAAGGYLGLASVLTLRLGGMFKITSNWLIPVCLLVALPLVLSAVRDRGQTILVATILPVAVVGIVFSVGTAPYIRQSLGVPHSFGHLALAVLPGVLAGLSMAIHRSSDVPPD